jgi:two-component sensor histidine kinase
LESSTEHEFQLASDSRAAASAREAVRSAVGDLPREVLSDVLLCVTELVTNSVSQPDADAGEMLVLTLSRTDSQLRVEVAERQRGVIVETARRTPGDPSFGLYIVELLSDRWGVERGDLRRL